MASIHFEYAMGSTQSQLEKKQVFAVFSFEGATPSSFDDPRHIQTGLSLLTTPKQTEVWHSSLPIEIGQTSGVSWCCNGELLLASIQINQNKLGEATFHAYSKLLSTISDMRFPHILRAWNYFADINQGDGDNERYKQFCSGRHRAFNAHDQKSYPAASAVGHAGGEMVIYVLAARQQGQHIENPMQLSAFKYPRQYGPESPSFSRATATNTQLYISGTASIRGHETIHCGDLEKQLTLTFDNIDQLLEHANKSIKKTAILSLLKIYIRDASNLGYVQQAIKQRYPGIAALFVQGDICRKELEVEIDGLCQIPI